MQIFFLLIALALWGDERPFVLLRCHEKMGMFNTFNEVLAAVKCYDKGRYQGIEIDFGRRGLYYDPGHGDNWWSYYCEPIVLGEKENVFEIAGDAPFMRRREIEWYTDREEACQLIQKYVHFKPQILEKVEAFQAANFTSPYMIGIHYRGTDKMDEEASFVSHSDLIHRVIDELRSLRQKRVDFRIFVASDEERLVNFVKGLFPNRVCYLPNCLRARKGDPPPHFNAAYDRYLCGEEALLDCILLSKCDLLIRTSSALSLWSTYLNPSLPVIELNQRIDDEKPKEE